MVTEPEKCQNLQLASWRLRWVNGTVLFDVQGLRTKRAATQTSRKKYTYHSRPKKSQLTHQDQRQEKTNVSARVARQDEFLSLFRVPHSSITLRHAVSYCTFSVAGILSS